MKSRWRQGAGALLILTLLAGLITFLDSGGRTADAKEDQARTRPNIIVIMTDDQDLASLRVMPKTRRLLGEQGTTFHNSYVSYSLCCPSRTTFFTGLYPHNHGVMDNKWPDGGYYRMPVNETLPVWLSRRSYATAHIGKFLNEYGTRNQLEIPPGWQDWYGLTGGSAYRMWGYTINENGVARTYGKVNQQDPKFYQTDVLARKAVSYIQQSDFRQPYFLSFAPLAPHIEAPPPGGHVWRGPRPAPRYRNALPKERAPRTPSFNERDMRDKPQKLRRKLLTAAEIKGIDNDHRNRLRGLLAVDDAVGKIFNTVKARGELDRTLFLFTSDNGYLLGQHRIRSGKIQPYEESIRVPLLVRGPGFAAGKQVFTPVNNVDLAPTIMTAATGSAGRALDGRPLQALQQRRGPRDILVETGPRWSGAPWYAAIRTDRYLYVEHSNGVKELYDMAKDPYQLQSLHNVPGLEVLRHTLSRRLLALRQCRGNSCP